MAQEMEKVLAKTQEEKEAAFLLMVGTTIQALMTAQLARADLDPQGKMDTIENLCSRLEEARQVAKRIPTERSVSLAVFDYFDHMIRRFIPGATQADFRVFNIRLEGCPINDPPRRGSWMGLQTLEELEALLGPTMVMIDGRHQALRPEWALLPFDDSLALKLLTHVRRSRTPVSISELAKVVRKNHDQTVSRLRELEGVGWVEDASAGDGRAWEATSTLIQTARGNDRPPPPTPEPAPPPKPYDWEAHHRRTHERAVEGLMNNPDSHTLLRMIRKKGPCGIRDLEDELPHLPRYRTLSLLKRLRTQGWLDVIGKARRAEWVATEKLAAGMPKRSKAKAEGSV